MILYDRLRQELNKANPIITPTYQIIEECQEFGYEFVTGGFVDRIGDNGKFPKITMESNVWKEMPEAGFFRYPMSKACPNKVTLMKGNVKVSNGQHYVEFEDGTTSWGSEHLSLIHI